MGCPNQVDIYVVMEVSYCIALIMVVIIIIISLFFKEKLINNSWLHLIRNYTWFGSFSQTKTKETCDFLHMSKDDAITIN